MKNKRIKLTINAVPLAPGGGMVGLLGYLRAWKEMDAPLEITLYASRQMVIDSVCEVRPDIEVVPFVLGQPSWRHFLLQQLTLGRKVMKCSPDVVMSTNMLTPHCRVPQLVHHQNLYMFIPPEAFKRIRKLTVRNVIQRAAAKRALFLSSVNVFISEYMQKMAESIVPESKQRNHVVYNGLSKEVLRAGKIVTSFCGNKKQLLAIQDTQPHKDNPTLIRIMHHLMKSRPEVPWELNIAGGGNWDSIKVMAKELGVLDKINFLGYLNHDKLDKLLRRSLCMVYSSVLEGFGNPPLEAMANGCPVVACNCTAIPEVVGAAGILVEPSNANAFSTAICKIHDQEEFRQDLVMKGLQRVNRFTWEKSASEMLEVFNGLSHK